jgi:carboxypeptidase family protein
MHLRPAVLKLAGAAALTATLVATVLASAPAGAINRPRPHPATGAAALRAQGLGAHGAATTGVLAGRLTGTGGRPVSGACVIAAGRSGSAMVMTRPDGRYALSGLRAGSYRLHVTRCAAPSTYFDPAGQSSVSALVSIRTGQVAAAPRLRLAALALGLRPSAPATGPLAGLPAGFAVGSALATGRGGISGTVTGHGKPLKNVCVFSYGPTFRSARTGSNGHYHLGRLRAGRYFVRFLPFCISNHTNWLPQWYKGLNGFFFFGRKRPTTVHVTAGHTTTGINAALELGGQIGGVVRNKAGTPLRGICVEAFATGKSRFPFFFGGFADTGRNGGYVMHALFPATYKVLFSRECGNRGNYGFVWWRHSATRANATPITLTSGRVRRHINARMPRGATISGVVRAGGPTGQRLAGICVYAEPRSNNGQFSFTRTGTNGGYKLIALTTGRYRIFFVRCRNNANVLPETRTVSLRTGQNITRFDAFLQPGAIVSGTVTNTHGAPVGGVCVQVSGRDFEGTITKADGTYSMNGLHGGDYTVQFSPGCGSSGSYAPQFYKGQTNPASADQVPLIQDQTTAGIGAVLQPGGTISGTVTDSSGTKLGNICVDVANLSQSQFPFFYGSDIEFTAKDGTYSAENLAPGLYAVGFNCFGNSKFSSEWFMNQRSAGSANLVSAPAGAVTTGISAALAAPGSIKGTVTNHWGKPVPNICVLAIPAGSPYPQFFFGGNTGYTGRLGGYTIRRLAPGSYDLQFQECGRSGRYGSQWNGDKPTEQSSVPVTVTSAQVTTGINASMRLAGSISGTITADSPGLQFGCVQAEDLTTESFGFAYTGNGTYTIKGLSTGTYQVIFSDCSYPAHFGTVSTQVTVTAPKAVTGVNAHLTAAGSIAGTVTAAVSGRPLAGVCVAVVPASTHLFVGEGVTDDNGRYTVTGLGAGTYKVEVGDQFCPAFFGFGPFFIISDAPNYAPQWYNGQPTQAVGTPVTVSAGTVSTGIDGSLSLDGAISGTVTDASNTPVVGECVTAVPVSPVPDPLFGRTLNNVIAVTGAGGTYSLADLPPGKYQVEFSTGCGATGFATQWWKNASSQHTATTITVSATGTVTGISATLQH